MAANDLQFMFSAPRDKSAGDPRVAANFYANKEVGTDGKLYMLVPEEDQKKFKVLDDSGIINETKRNEELRKTVSSALKSSSSQLDSHGFPRQVQRPTSSPAASKKRTSSSPLNTSNKERNVDNTTPKTQLPSSPIASSKNHDMDNATLSQAASELASTLGVTDEIDTTASSDAKLLAVVSAMQKKYSDSLEMVAKVCAEKNDMQELLKTTTKQLQFSRRSVELHKQLRDHQGPPTTKGTKSIKYL